MRGSSEPIISVPTVWVISMSETRTVRVSDPTELDARRDDLERAGYHVVNTTPATVTLTKRDHGSSAWHLFVFVATFWWSIGFGNLAYALYRRYVSFDRVTIRIIAPRD